jgi:hypothetical protein
MKHISMHIQIIGRLKLQFQPWLKWGKWKRMQRNSMNSLLPFWRLTLTSLVLIAPRWVANYNHLRVLAHGC